MIHTCSKLFSAAVILNVVAIAGALAEERSIKISGGVGFSSLIANELVFERSGNQISQLIWESKVPIVSAKFDAQITANSRLVVTGTLGIPANGSNFVDYDWLTPYRTGFGPNEWTHRSIHPDTSLNHYRQLDITYSRRIKETASIILDAEGGFNYVNTKWTARSGSYTYSTGGFRDTSGNFTAGQAVISYEQTFPTFYAGLNATHEFNQWQLNGYVRGGLAVNVVADDYHFLRNLRFVDYFDYVPYAAVGGEISRTFGQHDAKLFISTKFQQYFRSKGDIQTSLISNPSTITGNFVNSAGIDFQSIEVKVGLKVPFN